MHNLSIFITTMNRKKYLDALLSFYSKTKFKGKILIGDSSDIPYIKSPSLDVDVSIVYNKDITQSDFFCQIVDGCTTEYLVYSGDDDFLILDDLDQYYQLLSKNALIGLPYWALFVDKHDIPDTVSMPFLSLDLELFGDSDLCDSAYQKKQICFATEYRSLMFTVAKREIWQKALLSANKYKSKSVNAEIAIGAYLLKYSNKYVLANSIGMIRLQHPNLFYLSETSESKLERVKLAIDILENESLNYKIGDLYNSGPDKTKFRESLLVSNVFGDHKTYKKLFDVAAELRPEIFNCKNLSFVYWGNKATLHILVQFILQTSAYDEKYFILLSNQFDLGNDGLNKFELIKDKLLGVKTVSPYLDFNDIDFIELCATMQNINPVNRFISISNIMPFEVAFTKKVIPKKVVLIWPHMSNLINHPFIFDQLVKNRYIGLREKISLYSSKIFLSRTIIILLVYLDKCSFEFLSLYVSFLKNKHINLPKQGIKYINTLNKQDRKYYNFVGLIPGVLKDISRVILKLFSFIGRLFSRFLAALSVLSAKFYTLIKKIILNPDFVISRRFDAYSLLDKFVRYEVGLISYVMSVSHRHYYSYVLLEQYIKSKMNTLISMQFIIDQMTQIGSYDGNCEIYTISRMERDLVSILYPKANVCLLDIKYFNIGSNLVGVDKIGLLTISIGLLPRTDDKKCEFIKEFVTLIKNQGISRLIFRPHPAMNNTDVQEFYKFIYSQIRIPVEIDNFSLEESLSRSSLLFTTISGVISEIDEVDHSKIFIIKSLSKITYPNIDLLYKLYPNLNK